MIVDYVAIEMHRLPRSELVRKNYEILGQHPTQVQILKGSRQCAVQKGELKGLRRRLLDGRATAEFPKFVKAVLLQNKFSESLLQQRKGWADEGIKYADSIGATFLHETPNVIKEIFSGKEIEIIRRKEKYTKIMVQKILDLSFYVAWVLLKSHPTRPTSPTGPHLVNNIIFRFSLGMSLQIIRWVRTGRDKLGPQRPDLIRNDLIDAFIVAYGTLFDGLISEDQKVSSLYDEVAYLVPILQTRPSEDRPFLI